MSWHILIIEPRPIGKLTNMCKQIIIPNLTGTTDCSNCPTINKCIHAFISINDNSKLMQPNEIPNLFNKLIEEGFNINTDPAFRKDAYLFGEAQSRVVVSIKSENEVAFLQFLEEQNIANTKLGKVFGSKVTIDDKEFGEMNEWKNVYDNTLKNKLEE